METKKIVGLLLCLVFLARPFSAFETDQFNLPSAPLADIGDEVTDYALENISKAIGKLNSEIAAHQACLESAAQKSGCDSPDEARAELRRLRSEETLARAVFKPLGGGIPPFTNSGTWMEAHEFRARPARFKAPFGKSIYRASPLLYLTISETVKLYGVELGTDKIAHIFQQGYTYYQIARRARAKNLSAEEAVRKAVGWGRMTEKTYYGYWVSGVYSNADLAANYAGMKFYENLTREIKIGAQVFPPLLVLKDGVWKINENANLREHLIKPFISNHLNEALNPSLYIGLFNFRASIRRAVKKHACPQWTAKFPAADADDLTNDLKRWYGEDYGFKESADFITIAAACFGNKTK